METPVLEIMNIVTTCNIKSQNL